MGAGQGKSRRVRKSGDVAAMTSLRVKYQAEKWEEFIDTIDLKDVSVREYYLGKKPALKDLSLPEEEASRIISELFKDMVTTGVITLPVSYKADDFALRVHPPEVGSLTLSKMVLSLRNRPEKRFEFVNMTAFLRPLNTMASPNIVEGMERVALSMNVSMILRP